MAKQMHMCAFRVGLLGRGVDRATGGLRRRRLYHHVCKAPIETIGKLGQIAKQVLRGNGMIGSVDRVFDVTQKGVDPGEGFQSDTGTGSPCNDDFMATARCRHGGKASETVRNPRRPPEGASPTKPPFRLCENPSAG